MLFWLESTAWAILNTPHHFQSFLAFPNRYHSLLLSEASLQIYIAANFKHTSSESCNASP